LDGKVSFAATASECIQNSDVVVVATPWQEFQTISAKRWARQCPSRIVIDCWRVLKDLEGCDGVQYFGLGTGNTLGSGAKESVLNVVSTDI
jgi:predicted dinucleotide-binding enzyme